MAWTCYALGLSMRLAECRKAEERDFVLEDCASDVYAFDNTPDALHVLYADDDITAIHPCKLTVSPEEDLKLNARGSDDR